MAPPPPQESFTFTVGKLGKIYVHRDPRFSLILLGPDAGMAVGLGLFNGYANLTCVLPRFVLLDSPGRACTPHRVSVAVVAAWCDRRFNREHCRPPEPRRGEETG